MLGLGLMMFMHISEHSEVTFQSDSLSLDLVHECSSYGLCHSWAQRWGQPRAPCHNAQQDGAGSCRSLQGDAAHIGCGSSEEEEEEEGIKALWLLGWVSTA